VQIPLHTSTCLRLCQVVVPSGFGPSRGSRWAHGRAVCAHSGRSTRRVHFIKHTSAGSLGTKLTKLSVFRQSTHPPTYIRVQTPSPCRLLPWNFDASTQRVPTAFALVKVFLLDKVARKKSGMLALWENPRAAATATNPQPTVQRYSKPATPRLREKSIFGVDRGRGGRSSAGPMVGAVEEIGSRMPRLDGAAP
jgi:hypothetical protein